MKENMLGSLMEEHKRLDLNAPLLSVRRFASAPPHPAPSSSSNTAAAAANSRAGDGGRGSSLPFYKSELKSGPVRNPGVVPFVWEKSPGQPKDSSGHGGAPDRPVGRSLAAPKPPPGRIPSRYSDEKEEPIGTEAINIANNTVPPHGPAPISSTPTSAATITSVTTEDLKQNSKTKPMAEEAPILEEEQASAGEEIDEEEDAFSDALDTLSRAESCFMNCSINGLTDLREQPSGRFLTDPHVRDFMMGRFLPAAQAVATRSPRCASRKYSVPGREPKGGVLGNAGDPRQLAVPLPYQHRPNYQANTGNSVKGDDDDGGGDDDEEEHDDTGNVPVKGCGLLPSLCLKSSFSLLNPVPGMKVRGRMPVAPARRFSPHVRALHHGSVGDAEEEHTWEEVYKHKLGRVDQILGEEASKLTSESNQLSYWSDSQTADGSSSYRRSTGGGISPEGKGFVDVPNRGTRRGEEAYDQVFEVCGKDGEKFWKIMPHLSHKQTCGSVSPVIEKTVHVDSVEVLGKPGSKLSFSDDMNVTGCEDKDFEIAGESWRIGECLMFQACEDKVSMLQHKVSETVDADELCSAGRSGALESMDDAKDHVLDGLQHLEAEDRGKNGSSVLQALLPPPLPKSPSESWLWRTLPSVASKHSTPTSFLGVQFCPKKQVLRAPLTDPSCKTSVKKSVGPKGQMRFADVLAKPANED